MDAFLKLAKGLSSSSNRDADTVHETLSTPHADIVKSRRTPLAIVVS